MVLDISGAVFFTVRGFQKKSAFSGSPSLAGMDFL